MPTQGRTGFQDALTGTGTWDVLYATPTDGEPLKGVSLGATDQDVLYRITGLHNFPDGTFAEERVVAGTTVERFSFKGDRGVITKIEAKAAVAGAKATWAPVAN